MNSDKKAIDDFLSRTGMHPDRIDMDSMVNHMMDDMKRGLAGQKASMEMIPTFIEVDSLIPENRKVIVLDAGGTNLRSALVSFNSEGKPLIEKFTKQPMPGTQGLEVSREEFFNSMAALVEPLVAYGEKIGFCFSYPTEIFPDRDGRLIRWTKEVRAPGVVGRTIGADLREALAGRGVSNPPEVVILNDTVATVLAGKASQRGRNRGGYIGLILGTGTNTCYVESNEVIRKVEGLNPEGRQVVNCESGGFACRFRGEADLLFCSQTELPDFHVFEKMISGRYFGPMTTQTLLMAGEAGLFTDSLFTAIGKLGEISTKDADNYVHNPDGSGNVLVDAVKASGNEADARRVWFIIDALLERAARLTAGNLAAAVLKGEGGRGPLTPTCITIDGTTYYRYYRFAHRVESYLRPFLISQDMYYETVQVDDAPLLGAAVAALTN